MDENERLERRRIRRRRRRIQVFFERCILGLVLILLAGGIGVGCFKFANRGEKKASKPTSVGVSAEDALENPKQNSNDEIAQVAKGVTVVVDAGHGERVPGCVAGDIYEKDITLGVAKKLKECLETMGATVVMTRVDDSYPRLWERAALANEKEADYFISIHCNAYEEDTSISGFESYYYGEDSLPLAEAMVAGARKQAITTIDAKYGNFQVLRDTKMPATLVEIGYMTNPMELQQMCSEDYQKELALSMAEGLKEVLTK